MSSSEKSQTISRCFTKPREKGVISLHLGFSELMYANNLDSWNYSLDFSVSIGLPSEKKKMKGNVLSLCAVVQANCVEELLINAHRCDV